MTNYDPHEHRFYVRERFPGYIVAETLSDGFFLPDGLVFRWTLAGAEKYILNQRKNNWGYDENGQWPK